MGGVPRACCGLLLGLLSILATGGAQAVESMQVAQVSYLPASTYEEAGQEFQRMRAAGFDTVILRVFQNPGDRFYPFATPRAAAGVYFVTDEAKVVDDILPELIPRARAAGLRVFAWMSTLSLPLEAPWDLRGRRYDLVRGEIVAAERLDLFHPEVRRRLLTLFRDLGRYDLDGILLQDDLVLRHTEGYSAAAMGAYSLSSGRFPDPVDFYADRHPGSPQVRSYSPAFWDWARWRNRALLQLAADLRTAARQTNPRLLVAINLMYEALSNPQGALAWLAQDFEATRDAGFDYLSVMAYQRQMAKELKVTPETAVDLIRQMVRDGLARMTDPAALLVKVQATDFDSRQPIAAAEWQAVAAAVREAGATSVAVFPYHSPNEIPAPAPALKAKEVQ
jgi:poly-beta-1,6-N-acetyl-D-glucosamine N-deacetylase